MNNLFIVKVLLKNCNARYTLWNRNGAEPDSRLSGPIHQHRASVPVPSVCAIIIIMISNIDNIMHCGYVCVCF